MFRLEGLSHAIRGAFPAEYAGLYELVTSLGGATTILFGLAVAYWVGRRRETATVIAAALVVLSATLALKSAFALPRPPAAVRSIAAPGYGFPSGHAAAATAVYGGIAYEYGYHRRVATAVPVAALVGAVGLSRVVLGVHYLGDVLAGFLLGAVVVLAVSAVAEDGLVRAFALAAACSALALAVAGAGEFVVLDVGASVGGLAGAAALDRVPDRPDRAEAAATAAVGLAFVVGVRALDGALGGSPVVGAAVDGVLVAGVLLVPVAVAHLGLDRSPVGSLP